MSIVHDAALLSARVHASRTTQTVATDVKFFTTCIHVERHVYPCHVLPTPQKISPQLLICGFCRSKELPVPLSELMLGKQFIYAVTNARSYPSTRAPNVQEQRRDCVTFQMIQLYTSSIQHSTLRALQPPAVPSASFA